MSNSWVGGLAKIITSRKRTKKFWNIFFVTIIMLILLALSAFLYQLVAENVTYQSEQTFIEYTDGQLITEDS